MDSASSIERRIAAMKQVYKAGIRTVCFVSPVFPGITDFEAIFERVKDQCDPVSYTHLDVYKRQMLFSSSISVLLLVTNTIGISEKVRI